MPKILRSALAIIGLAVIVIFAVDNRHAVDVSFWPLPFGTAVPAYVLPIANGPELSANQIGAMKTVRLTATDHGEAVDPFLHGVPSHPGIRFVEYLRLSFAWAGFPGFSILEGDPPHLPRGAAAQAWGVSEVLRVWRVLAREIALVSD